MLPERHLWHDLVARLETSLQRRCDPIRFSDHLVVRLAVSGTTPLAWNMRRDADLLRTEAETRAESMGNVWIDKLEIDCRRLPAGATASADQLRCSSKDDERRGRRIRRLPKRGD